MKNKYLFISNSTSVFYNSDEGNYFISDMKQNCDDVNEIKKKAQAASFKCFADEISKYASHFKNVAVLTAAGTSMDNGEHSGKTRDGLWEECKGTIEDICSKLYSENIISQDSLKTILSDKDIESFLSLVMLFEKLSSKQLKDSDGKSLKKKLEKQIADACNLTLDDNNNHHLQFLQKLLARKPSDPRVQLYTTNYDKLFEQAAQKIGAVVIDGFSFTLPRKFSGINFDRDFVYRERTRIKQEESFIPNVFQLYKLHGSIDWQKEPDGSIIQKEGTEQPCIIYPANDKYESSYEQPYFEMMAHFQQTLRKEGTLLIVVGFGFKDKHIQNVIKEAVSQNPNFHLLIVCYGGEEKCITNKLLPEYIVQTGDKISISSSNVSVLYSTFKEFVENYPLNQSYSEDALNNAPGF